MLVTQVHAPGAKACIFSNSGFLGKSGVMLAVPLICTYFQQDAIALHLKLGFPGVRMHGAE
jgi:hypothetical protein